MYAVYAVGGFPGDCSGAGGSAGRPVRAGGVSGGPVVGELLCGNRGGVRRGVGDGVICGGPSRGGQLPWRGRVRSLLELRRGWWALPPLALLLGQLPRRLLPGMGGAAGSTPPRPCSCGCARVWPRDSRRLWLVTACAVAASGINPNGFGVLSTVFAYRRSPMTANLIEWHPPSLWGPPYGFDILLYAAALVLVALVEKSEAGSLDPVRGFCLGVPVGLPQHTPDRLSGAGSDCRVFSVPRQSAAGAWRGRPRFWPRPSRRRGSRKAGSCNSAWRRGPFPRGPRTTSWNTM